MFSFCFDGNCSGPLGIEILFRNNYSDFELHNGSNFEIGLAFRRGPVDMHGTMKLIQIGDVIAGFSFNIMRDTLLEA